MDIAALGFEVDSSQARGAAKALADLNSAAISAANGAAKFEKTLRGVDGRFRSTNDYLAENIREVEALARAYNPVMAAQIAYRDEVLRTATAVKAGVITEQQRAQILSQTKTRLDQAAAASQRFGQTQTVASHHVANLSFQLNDIGMMMASGQSPFMLMIQQGPQVAQIFSQIKQSGQSLGGTLAGAFRMILNPTTLLTLGVVAGTAALYQWLTAADDAASGAKNLGDGVDDLKSKIDALGSGNFKFNVETGKLEVSLDKIVEKYGTMNSEVQRHITLLQEANAVAAGFASLNFMAGFEESFSSTLGYLTTRVDEVRIAFGTTNDTARELIFLMQQAGDARGITAQRQAAEALRDRILNVTGGIQNMTAEQVKYFVEVSRAVDQLRIAETQLSRNTSETVAAAAETARWEAAMRGVLSYVNAIGQSLSNISGTGIAVAAARVEADMLRQGKTLREAGLAAARETARLEGEKRTSELQKQYGLWGKVLGAAETAAKQLEISEQASLDILREQARERERAEAKAASGGGRGGGGAARGAAAELKQAEKGFQSLRELLEKDTLFQFAEYEKRQAQLQAALDKRLVTEETYHSIKSQLQQYYFGAEYQQNALQYKMSLEQLISAREAELITEQQYAMKRSQLQYDYYSGAVNTAQNGLSQELSNFSGHFQQMNELAGGGYDGLLKAQKVFAASSALINSYLAATQALADPTVPFWGKIAAYAKVLAAGLGAVNAIKSGGSSGGGGGKSTSSAASAAAKTEPTRQVLVRLEGDDWLVDMAENIMTQIYEQSKDGRVIVARDRS